MPSGSKTIQLSKALTKKLLPLYEPRSPILKKIASYIHSHQKFLLTTHVRSDADGIGSQIALYYLLKKLNKECWILNQEPPGKHLVEHLNQPIVDDFSRYQDNRNALIDKLKSYFVLILDSSEIERSDEVGRAFSEAGCSFASIDHHILKAKQNYCIDASYAATCEIIWDLYHYLKIPIPKPAAISLYIGLVADSGNFRFNKTSFRTHLAGAELVGYGIDTDHIYRMLYESFPIDRLRLLKKIFKTLEINSELGYVLGEVLPSMKRGLELGDSSTEGIVNQLLAVNGVYIAALISKTNEGHLKCSLRSIGDVDVSDIAKKFQGGGHRNASGLKIEESYRTARKKLINALKAALSK